MGGRNSVLPILLEKYFDSQSKNGPSGQRRKGITWEKQHLFSLARAPSMWEWAGTFMKHFLYAEK